MFRLSCCALLFAAICPIAVGQVQKAQSDAKFFPPSTSAFVETQAAKELISTIFDHPLRERIEELDAFKKATKTQDYKNFMLGVLMVEGQVKMPWREALEAFLDQGACLGFEAKTQSAAIILHGKDSATMKLLRDKAIVFARLDPKNKVGEREYRDITVYSLKGMHFATIGDRFVIANKPDFGKEVVDRILDGGTSLAEDTDFINASKTRQANETAWGFVNIKTIRESGAAKNVFKDQINNPVAELMFGGIQSCLKETPYAAASFVAETDLAGLKIRMPFRSDWMPEPREYYFGAGGSGRGLAIPKVDETLFTLSTHRAFNEMWLWTGDLFNAEINDGFAQADAQLTTFFSGKDFGEDILGSLEPEVGFVAARQDFTDKLPRPTIKVPSFALIMNMKEPEKMTRDFRRIFQSLVGFLNVVGAMEGNPQLEMDMEKNADGSQMVTATYVPEEGEQKSTDAPLVFNFSPTVAFKDGQFVVSSTTSLAKQILHAQKPAPAKIGDNTHARLYADSLQEILSDNREQLIAQNMLEDGNSREEAEAVIDLLMQFIGYYRDSTLRLGNSDDQLEAEFTIRLKP